MKASVQCYSKGRKVKNNFVNDCAMLDVGKIGYLVLVHNKSKNFEVDGLSPDFENNTLMVDYSYEVGDKEFSAVLEVSQIPKGEFEVFTRWRKSSLEVFLIKKNFKYKFKENIKF